MAKSWNRLNAEIEACRRCPRLISHCQEIGRVKRRAYQDWDYWAGPVGNFGTAPAGLLVVGLAPGAHGANRTGRMFTGDRSGDWLYRALHRQEFATQPSSTSREDGLKLNNCVITAICHCAPPGNKPTATERQHCREWLTLTLASVQARVYVALGRIAWDGLWRELTQEDGGLRKIAFGHGVEARIGGGRLVIGCYHPSQQNTFTGRLTEPMLDDIFIRAREWIDR